MEPTPNGPQPPKKPLELTLPFQGPPQGAPPAAKAPTASPQAPPPAAPANKAAAAAPAQAPAATPAASPKVLSNLQRYFNGILASTKQPASKGGFFGGSGSAKPAEIDALVVNVVQAIVEEAVRARASDIHLEPLEEALRVRFRVDGLLEEVLEIPNALKMRVIPRVRVMCGLDPEQGSNSAKPQDGRMMVTVEGKPMDVRLSTFPVAYGDKLVLRLIQRQAKIPDFSQLGLKPAVVETMLKIIRRPQGMVVATGPAGNGKSTTLYTVLNALNDNSRNIVTLEDPVELRIKGINQGAVQIRAGLTFSEGLRAILRQDPNVIMVGEIRDRETAEIALSAALSGHLIFTTLHTSSALGAVARLMEMGLEPYLVASALSAVFAQRLVRRICPQCQEAYSTPAEIQGQLLDFVRRAKIRFPVEEIKQLHRGKGCGACRGAGYSGRVLLFEMIQPSSKLRRMILEKTPVAELQKTAVEEGMETLLSDGLEKVRSGATSYEELLRVVSVDD